MRRVWGVVVAILAVALAAPAQVVINEVLYDTRSGDSADSVYTELHGVAGTDLTGWSLVGVNGNNGDEYRTVTLSGTIPPDGYFLIGNNTDVWTLDLNLNVGPNAGVDWQNAGSSQGDDCDGVSLKNAQGTVVDHVCYGVCASAGTCEGEGGANAPDPFPAGGIDKAIARVPDHQDTDNNAADWQISENLTPGAANEGGVPCEPLTVPLADLRENDDNGVPVLAGSFVVVRGVVNVSNFTFDTLSTFYMQDEDAGVNVFRGPVPQGIMEGDCVEVSGWVAHYNGLTEIVSSGTGNCVFRVQPTGAATEVEPVEVHTGAYLEAFEGMLVRINNVTVVDGDWPAQGQWANLTIADSAGTIVLRIDSDTNVDGAPEPNGAFSIVGILTQFDDASPFFDNYQITPRYATDVLYGTAVDNPLAAPVAAEFQLEDAYPNPFNGSTQIRFHVGAARELELRIFDLLGREVAHERLTGLTPGAHTVTWSPMGATGLYLAQLEGASGTQTAKLLYMK